MRMVSIEAEAEGDQTKVTTVSRFSGKKNTLLLPLPMLLFEHGMERWDAGVLVQDAFPTLSPSQREFLMTGVTDEEWNAEFPPDDDED